jgi:hypothetical protein
MQFITSANSIKKNNPQLYELLIRYTFNYNKIIGDSYYGMKISTVFDIINSYINMIETKQSTKQEDLADIYINLNYIIEYLPSFKTYVDNVLKEKDNIINIFNKEVEVTTTSGVSETTSGVSEEIPQ